MRPGVRVRILAVHRLGRVGPTEGQEDRVARERLVQQAVEGILDRIVDEEFGAGEPLPSQTELAQQLGVSRLTVREAVETLRSRGIVQVKQGTGTFVRPPQEWVDADAISRLVGRHGQSGTVSRQVLQVRRMVEIGAAELSATERTDDDVEELERCLATMRSAHVEGDVETFVTADIAFHDAVLRGCRNPFLAVVYDPLMRVLRETRTETSSVAAVREHAIEWHAQILEAVRAGDGAASGAAMAGHMQQTLHDLETLVRPPGL